MKIASWALIAITLAWAAPVRASDCLVESEGSLAGMTRDEASAAQIAETIETLFDNPRLAPHIKVIPSRTGDCSDGFLIINKTRNMTVELNAEHYDLLSKFKILPNAMWDLLLQALEANNPIWVQNLNSPSETPVLNGRPVPNNQMSETFVGMPAFQQLNGLVAPH